MSALAGSRISTKPSGFVPALVSILYVVCSKALLVCGGFHEVEFPVTERYDDLAFSLTPSSTKRYKMHMLLKVSIPAKMKREEFQFV